VATFRQLFRAEGYGQIAGARHLPMSSGFFRRPYTQYGNLCRNCPHADREHHIDWTTIRFKQALVVPLISPCTYVLRNGC